jgi:asparagine N-glycosylation enzyme membrane subunit Stt3
LLFCRFLLEPERSLGHLQRERGQYHAGKLVVVVVVLVVVVVVIVFVVVVAFYEAFKLRHRVDGVLSFFSVARIGTSSHPHTQACVYPPPFGSGGAHSLAGDGLAES